MKVSEAIEILRQMNPEQEVQLVFNPKSKSDYRRQDPCPPGWADDHPCGGSYETQSERFGH